MRSWPLVLGGVIITLSMRRKYPAPLKDVVITSPYGPRVVGGAVQQHNGVDLRAAVGTPVYAVADGVATWGANDRSGNYLLIQSGDLTFGYAHLSRFDVAQGERVTKGQQVALSGNTGNTRGAHLHFTVKVNGETVDPAQYVRLA